MNFKPHIPNINELAHDNPLRMDFINMQGLSPYGMILCLLRSLWVLGGCNSLKNDVHMKHMLVLVELFEVEHLLRKTLFIL